MIIYAFSEGWAESQNTNSETLSHVKGINWLQSTDVSIVPVPQHDLSGTLKPEIFIK